MTAPLSHDLTGAALIAGQPVNTSSSLTGASTDSDAAFRAINPATGEALEPSYHATAPDRIDAAAEAAGRAATAFRRSSPATRAALLRAIASEIEALGDTLTERYVAESGLPRGRAEGERGRTCGQLRLFAAELENPGWNRAQIELADPQRQPLPKPDTRLRYIGVGPVAVFGPSNFPLAFSVAGGDTASALAAGCPVIVKAHPSHPGTSELIGRAITRAIAASDLPAGGFSLIYGGAAAGARLVQHPAICAVGFTGSETAGRALYDLAAKRPRPIPVFAEMSSVNPVLILPDALAARGTAIAEGLAASVTLGVGQFCTNPGLVLLPAGAAADAFAKTLHDKLAATAAAPMLNAGIRQHYVDGVQHLAATPGVAQLLAPSAEAGPGRCHATPALLRMDADALAKSAGANHEIFGPVTVLVTCADVAAMRALLPRLGGQLTITVHAEAAEWTRHADLVADLEAQAGRVLANGFPTGVEVCATMVHGGPYPATTDSRFTSVGTRAIDRFLRPVCYQGFPAHALPAELRNA